MQGIFVMTGQFLLSRFKTFLLLVHYELARAYNSRTH